MTSKQKEIQLYFWVVASNRVETRLSGTTRDYDHTY
jgi:hypothetical protein